MKIVKSLIKRALGALGYELYRLGEGVDFNNFANIAQAFEQRLVESGYPITENKIRSKLLARRSGTLPSQAYFIVGALAKCKDVSGDVCEFGVAQGETSALMANEIQISKKTIHLFDSFEGLPMPTEQDQLKDDIFSLGSMEAYAGTMANPVEKVLARFRAISFSPKRFIIHRGFVDRVFRDDLNLPKDVSFAYVDFDFYEPIKLALHFLHRTIATGGIIIVDDYDFFSTGAKTAVDEFIKEMNSGGMVYECEVPNTRYGNFAIITRIQ